MKLVQLLQLVAAIQLMIAIMNLFLFRMMKWQPELGQLSLLVREVVQVHSWFISIILGFFAILTLRFQNDMATLSHPFFAWFAAGIGIFWLFRTFLQLFYYSPSHWRGRPVRTLIHIACLAVYGGMSAVYLFTANPI